VGIEDGQKNNLMLLGEDELEQKILKMRKILKIDKKAANLR